MAAVTGGGAEGEEEGGARSVMRRTTRAMQMETGDMTASTSSPRVSRTVAAEPGGSGASATGSMPCGGGDGRGEMGNFSRSRPGSLAPRGGLPRTGTAEGLVVSLPPF